jgi:sec-independent protein translocase protein TatA
MDRPADRLGQISKDTPMLSGLTGFHLLVLVAVIVVIFGAAKLPVFAKSLGQSVKIMRGELQSSHEPEAAEQPVVVPAATAVDTPRSAH